MKNLIILTSILILGIWGIIHLYQESTYIKIYADFAEMRPTSNKLLVYYKGMKVGRVENITISSDLKSSKVMIVLFSKNLKFPNNIFVKLKKEKQGRRQMDVLEIKYPEVSNIVLLKKGDTIKGISTIDMETYAANQDPESLNKMRENMTNSAKNLNDATESLAGLIGTLNMLMEDIQPNIKATTKNIAKTSNNLTQMTENVSSITEKVDNSLEQEQLNQAVSSIEASIENIKEVTKNVEIITQTVDGTTKTINTTVPKLDATVENAGCIVSNLCEITTGVSNTLKKRFGVMRLLFGKTIDTPKPKYDTAKLPCNP